MKDIRSTQDWNEGSSAIERNREFMHTEARRAGSSFSKGDYLDAAGSMGLAAIAPLMIATPGSVKSVREISERALDSFKQLSFPGKKTNWWLDELEDKGTVTLYHGTNIKNLDKIKEEGLKVDRKGYTYATPDPETGVGYSVMARGEKASKGKKGKAYEQAPREERALLEIEVPKEMLERNIPLQRSPTSKEKLFSDKGLEKLVMISPNKKTYDEITSIMFQLYCGNDYGMGNFSLQFLDKTDIAWRQGRKKVAKNLGLSLVKNV